MGEDFIWARSTGSQEDGTDGPSEDRLGSKESEALFVVSSDLMSPLSCVRLLRPGQGKERGGQDEDLPGESPRQHTLRHLLLLLVPDVGESRGSLEIFQPYLH